MAAIDVQITASPTVTITHASVVVATPDPVTEQINGVTIGTVASGDTNNTVITNSGGVPVGTAANPSVVANSPLTINGSSIGSVAAEASRDIAVNLNGSPSGSWDGDSWEVTSSPFTVAASVDDNAAKFGATATLTATGTGLTGVTWYADGYEIGTGTPLAWTVNRSGSYTVTAVATDGSEFAVDTVAMTSALGQLIETDANAHRWWDFSQTATLTGDPVQTINDVKASGDNLTQGSVALRPARGTVNGLVCGEFVRASGTVLDYSSGSTTNYPEVTWIMGLKPTDVWTNTTDRIWYFRKNGQNDFNGANSIAIQGINLQCLGGSKKSNMGAGIAFRVIRLSVSGGYINERLYSRSDYIETQISISASQLGLIMELIRWGNQVSHCGLEVQVFNRLLLDAELDTEVNKLRWKWGAELT